MKHAAFLDGEAIWPQAVQERGQSFSIELSAGHALSFNSVAVLQVEESLSGPRQQQARS